MLILLKSYCPSAQNYLTTLRFPLLKNPEDLSEGQASALGAPRRSGTALWRGY